MLPVACRPKLPRFVEGVQQVKLSEHSQRYVRLPDGRTTLVFRVLEQGHFGDVCAVGPRSRIFVKEMRAGHGQALVVQFKPGWSVPFFGVGAQLLTDQIVPLQDLWGEQAGSALCVDLLRASGLAGALTRVVQAIDERMVQFAEPAPARLARRAAFLFESGETQVQPVARRLGVTPRHLRRAFLDHVGVTPKDFARMARLQRALRLGVTVNNWASVAVGSGYYDQSHFIAEFREFVGETPASLQQRWPEALGAQGGLITRELAASHTNSRRHTFNGVPEKRPLRGPRRRT